MTNSDRRGPFRIVCIVALLMIVAVSCSDDAADIDSVAPDAADTSDGDTPEDSADDADTDASAGDGADETDEPTSTDEGNDDAAGDDNAGDDNAGDDTAADDGGDNAVNEGGDDAAAGDDDAGDEPADTTTTTVAAAPGSTTTLPAETGLPPVEDRGQNDAGVRIDLDETATLACANAEFARDAIREDLLDDALRYAAAAADRAEPSAVTGLADLADTMRAAQSGDEIVAVMTDALDVCVSLGHQL